MLITKKVYVTGPRDRRIDEDTYFSYYSSDISECLGEVLICESEISFEILDDGEILQKQLDLLAEEEKAVKAATEAKLQNIEKTRQNLLSIAYKPDIELDCEVLQADVQQDNSANDEDFL